MNDAKGCALAFALLGACASDRDPASGATSEGTSTSGSDVESSTGTSTSTESGADTSAAASDEGTSNSDAESSSGGDAPSGRVHVVLFTHVEDATPGGAIGTPENRMQYLGIRARLIEMAELAQSWDLQWVLQPDWKILLAAQAYEDEEVTANTDGKNFLRWLVEDLGVVVDAHSHENGGYNYTDVAYLLEQLGVGGSTVIGGHIWDPSLPQFQAWDRFREPVPGEMYPEASWRGDILIGSGTPNHVNDPIVSGLWRPQDRDHYFDDDPNGNIVAVGAWVDAAAGVQELVDLYEGGTVAPEQLLTASWNIPPGDILADDGLATIESNVLVPIATLRDADQVVVTDFTTLVQIWTEDFGAQAFLWQP